MQKISVIAVVAISAAFLALVSFTLSEQDAKAIDRSAATQVAEDEVALLEVKAKYRRPSKIPFPEENPYSKARWDLGKALFFDPRLSGSNSISCASCHNPSFSWGDGLPVGVGHGSKPLGRRSPTILNAAWGELFMWDGRFGTLEEQALGPIGASVEMAMTLGDLPAKLSKISEYRDMFKAAFGDEKISLERVAMAIATDERTIVSAMAPFDRWLKGDNAAMSTSAKRGFELFNDKARCASCHQGWRFTDDSFHDVGLASKDIGRGKLFPKITKMQQAFKTPGLRNIDRRGPYMHDGSLADLMTVMRHYNTGGKKRPSLSDEMKALNLTEQEMQDVVAFMRTLTSEDEPVTFVKLPR